MVEGYCGSHAFWDFLLAETIDQVFSLGGDVRRKGIFCVFFQLFDVIGFVVAFLKERVVAGQHLIHNHSSCKCVCVLSVRENLVCLLWWLVEHSPTPRKIMQVLLFVFDRESKVNNNYLL